MKKIAGTLGAIFLVLLVISSCEPEETAAVSARLTGAPGAVGLFSGKVAGGRLCYTLEFSGVDQVTGAHLHFRSEDGGVANLRPFSSREEDCVAVSGYDAGRLPQTPADYYVHVHTSQFPMGAISGALSPGISEP